MTRTRTVPAPPERVWAVIANPERLAEWWPRVRRVEEADSAAWTTVVASDRGDSVLRADYTRIDLEHPRRLSWRHEVAASPFERVMSSSVTEIRLEPAEGGGTVATICERTALRGLSRLGALQVRRAIRRKLDRALDGLVRVVRGGGG